MNLKRKRQCRATIGISVLLPALLTSSCMVGPKYEKPDVAQPSTFRSQIGPSDAGSFADLPWWTVFDDRALQALITEAMANNLDLQIAAARIEQAHAIVAEVASQSKPQVGYQASGTGQRAPIIQNGAVAPLTYGAVLGLADFAWEFDVWGRIRHATDAAKANLYAQEDVRRGVILTLVSDLAASYFRLLELDEELVIAKRSERSYKDTVDLFTSRFEVGKDSKLPVERAKAAYQSSLAQIHDLDRRITQLENAISILLGGYPRAIVRGRVLTAQAMPQTPVGATTALLKRRPDILGAEQNMIGANAEIGEAVAEFFPKIGLAAFGGDAAIDIASRWHNFGVWSAALSAAGPIYTGGRLEGQYRERKAYWDETIAEYKQIVQRAFQETSDALIARQTLIAEREALEGQVRALQSSTDFALARYKAGRASYFEVLEALQQLYPAEYLLSQAERDQLLAVVDLYKALGGGWNPETPGTTKVMASTGTPPSLQKAGGSAK